MKRMPTLAGVMTPFPFSIPVASDVRAARAMMAEHGIRHLPVTRGGDLVGVVSDKDLLLAGNLSQDGAAHVGLDAICTEDPFVVDIATRVDVVVANMAELHIGSALVTKAGKLVGILTTTDACQMLADTLRELFPGPTGDITA